MTTPIFIVGANRSGTTLLRLLLNAHSRIAVPEEMGYMNATISGIPITQWRSPGWTTEQYVGFVNDFATRVSPHLPGVSAGELKHEILAYGPADLRHPYACALGLWTRTEGKARWGEKTPGNLFYVDVLVDMFPEARFLHLIRDPRAVVASLVRAPFCVNDVAINALNWRKHVVEGRALLERSVPYAQRFTLRYEDLVADPPGALRTVCAFLGERFEPEMLDFYTDARDYMKPEAAQGYNAAATGPVSRDAITKWRRHLSPSEVAMVEAICRREMEAFGYERERPGLRPTHVLEVVAKTTYWSAENWRNRRRPHYTLQHGMFARPRGRLREQWLRLAGHRAPTL